MKKFAPPPIPDGCSPDTKLILQTMHWQTQLLVDDDSGEGAFARLSSTVGKLPWIAQFALAAMVYNLIGYGVQVAFKSDITAPILPIHTITSTGP